MFLRWHLLCRPALRKHLVVAVAALPRRVQTLLLTDLQPNLLHLQKPPPKAKARSNLLPELIQARPVRAFFMALTR